MGQDGAVGPAEPLLPAPDTATIVSGIASDGAGYLVTWTRDDPTDKVVGVLLGPTGESVGGAFDVSPPDLYPSTTAASFDGANYLVLWTSASTLATRVSPAGVVLDPAGSLVADFAPSKLTVASSGERSISAWSVGWINDPPPVGLQGAEIGQDGIASPTFDISTSPARMPALAGGPGGQVLVAYTEPAGSEPGPRQVMVRLIDLDDCSTPEDCPSGSGGSGGSGGGGSGGSGGNGTGGGGGGQADEGPIDESCGCRVPVDAPRPFAPRWLAAVFGLLALRRWRRCNLRSS